LYVPDDWRTACYDHTITAHKVSFTKKLLCCTCGITGWNPHQLWAGHVNAENEARAFLMTIETRKADHMAKRVAEEKARVKARMAGTTTGRSRYYD